MPATPTDSPDTGSRSLLDGGVSATSPPPAELTVLVAPTAEKEHNTLRMPLVPVACFRFDDVRFAFDSSFLAPGIRAELPRLAALLRRHPPASLAKDARPARAGSPLSIFGHADPSGEDEYNKLLSGRRARAIHALLTRDSGAWNELHDRPHGTDKWGVRQIETMLSFLGRDEAEASAIERDPARRKSLFGDYMNALAGDALPTLEKADFLGEGKDAGGKAAFQGCGEFNPLLVFSQAREDAFAKASDKSGRNEANSANRRVLIYIFRAGSKVDPAHWPCPRASEGVAACRKRFWSDGESRRSRRQPEEDREFRTSEDTFACRFYHRLSDRSPCERAASGARIRLYSGFGRAIPFAPFSVTIEDQAPTPVERADGDGVIALPRTDLVESCLVRWDFPPKRGEDPAAEALAFERTVFLVPADAHDEEAARKRLHNLGYGAESRAESNGAGEGEDLATRVLAFQLDYGHLANPPLEPTGELDASTIELIERIESRAESDLREPSAE